MEIKNRWLIVRNALAVSIVIAFFGTSETVMAVENSSQEKTLSLPKREEAERRQKIDEISKDVKSAREASGKLDYPEADAIYTGMISKLKSIPGEVAKQRIRTLENELSTLRSAWANSILYKAKLAIADKRYSDAIVIANEAQIIDNSKLSEVSQLIDFCRDKEKNIKAKYEGSMEAADPNFKSRQKNVKILLNKADTLIKEKRYMDARVQLEQVFLLDPFNTNAIEKLATVYQQLYFYGTRRHKSEIAGIFSSGDWQWIEPVFPADINKQLIVTTEIDNISDHNIQEKLERIVFPSLEFNDANISYVVRYLSSRSKTFDPEKQGVTVNFAESDIANIGKVTMSFSNIPMSEILRYLCEELGLKYKIDSDSVELGRNVDDMYKMTLQIRESILKSATGVGFDDDNEEEDDDDDDSFGVAGESEGSEEFFDDIKDKSKDKVVTNSVGSTALKDFFESVGVEFPAGSAIVYYAGKLTVTNTPRNLQMIKELITQLDAAETNKPLIMIDVKAIEISEVDLQELGFDWSFSPLTNVDPSTGTVSGNSAWAFGEGSSSISQVRPNMWGTNTSIVNNWNVFASLFGSDVNIFGSKTPLDIFLTINALHQNTRTETLSAPKVVTESGQVAKIDMITEYSFPNEWETYELEYEGGEEDTSGVLTITVPTPSFDDSTDIGIKFTATPTVLPDRYTINMDINPHITSYLGRDSYPVSIGLVHVSYANGVRTESPETITYDVWMPIISERELKTSLTMYDGETVIVGGMLDSNTQVRLDKYPFFGDLPMIGRFFQSRAEDKQQRNLLLFVTARLLNNDGTPLRNVNNGAPDFNR